VLYCVLQCTLCYTHDEKFPRVLLLFDKGQFARVWVVFCVVGVFVGSYVVSCSAAEYPERTVVEADLRFRSLKLSRLG